MNIAVAIDSVPQAAPSASEAGPAPKRIVVAYGFWIFLLSDIVMFAALFASYAVLVHSTAGGPTGAQLFNQATVAIETACLLVSSYTCGLMSLAINSRRYLRTYLWRPDYLRARRRVSHSRDPRIRKHDRYRRNAAAQRFSFCFLHACRLPRASRHARTDLAGRDDGSGGGNGFRRHRAAPPALFLLVLARARHRLGRAVHRRLSNGSHSMTEARYDRAPGERPSREMQASAPSPLLVYTIGLFLARPSHGDIFLGC